MDEEDIAAVVEVLKSDFLTTGPVVGRFEAALAKATDTSHAVVVSSGTAALHAAYHVSGLLPGDEVVTTPLTFAATANAALYLGASVRFVDIQADTGNLDPERIESALSKRTKLIVAVDFAGHPADYDAITAIGRRHDIRVIADAAHSLGARYRGRSVGSLADLTTVSFHPVKPITSGEGGAVLGNHGEWARGIESFRNHGITRDAARLQRDEGPWFYEMQALGFNYRLTDIQCALGLSQLKKLGRFLARRRHIAERYTAAFSHCGALLTPVVRPDVEPGWHLYVVRLAGDPALRRPFFERLRALGLAVQVHYIPVYYHPYYASLGFVRGLCPVAEDFYRRAISLPLFPLMTDAEVDRVINRVLVAVDELL